MSSHRGFSLIELLVALVISVILLGLALPGYRAMVLKANRSIAKLVLLEVAARQELHWQERQRYSASLAELGLSEPYFVDAAAQAAAPQQAIYRIGLDWADEEYVGVSAVPVNGQADDRDCATLIYRRQGLREVSGRYRARPERCW